MPKKPKKGKSKKGKKGSKSSEPKLSTVEAFLQFQVQTKVDSCKTWRARRDDLRSSSEGLNQQLQATIARRQGTVADFSRRISSKESELSELEGAYLAKLQGFLKEKNQYAEEQLKAISDRKKENSSLSQEIKSKTSQVQALEKYRASGMVADASRISLLRQMIADALFDFEQEKADVAQRFDSSNQKFQSELNAQLTERTQHAIDHALMYQSVESKIAFSDYKWILAEIQENEAELDRITSSCARLEEENLSMLKDLLGEFRDEEENGDEEDRFGSVDDYKRMSMSQSFRNMVLPHPSVEEEDELENSQSSDSDAEYEESNVKDLDSSVRVSVPHPLPKGHNKSSSSLLSTSPSKNEVFHSHDDLLADSQKFSSSPSPQRNNFLTPGSLTRRTSDSTLPRKGLHHRSRSNPVSLSVSDLYALHQSRKFDLSMSASSSLLSSQKQHAFRSKESTDQTRSPASRPRSRHSLPQFSSSPSLPNRGLATHTLHNAGSPRTSDSGDLLADAQPRSDRSPQEESRVSIFPRLASPGKLLVATQRASNKDISTLPVIQNHQRSGGLF